MKIFHNPRCSKSRQGLEILNNSKQEFEIIRYLDQPLTKAELEDIIAMLGIQPIDLVRKNEAIWKSEFKNKTLDDKAIIAAMAQYPKLIERPIVVNNGKAVIGRPPELIKSIL